MSQYHLTMSDFLDELTSRLEYEIRSKAADMEEVAANAHSRGYLEGLEKAMSILEGVEYEWVAMVERGEYE